MVKGQIVLNTTWNNFHCLTDHLFGFGTPCFKIVQHFIQCFLLQGVKALRPLTRAQLADAVGLHESTVSRATASKYAQVPDGQVVALADFFDGSLKAKALIRDLISKETTPLTDGEIVHLLSAAGVTVARRTVAKYRQAMGILPSELR